VLKSPEVLAKLSDTKYARETRFMDDFMTLLRKDDGRAWYGPSEVEKAVEIALRKGYRHIDTALAYGNEAEVGRGIKNSGVPRSEIWLTTKLDNT